MSNFVFYVGTHEPAWLGRTTAPLFVSARRLRRRKRPPARALGPWALDSGGFSEIAQYGEWRTPAMQYASEVRGWRDAIGGLHWAAAQDWMCEPWMVEKTGLSVAAHQEKTVNNYCLLRQLAPDLPWVPVIQGYELREYFDCLELYRKAGVDLWSLPRVGLGSVCRRQATGEVERVVRELAATGLRLHGFGMKLGGLARCRDALASSDSMAWSYRARRSPPLPGCRHKSCANCMAYALAWRARVVRAGWQGDLPYAPPRRMPLEVVEVQPADLPPPTPPVDELFRRLT